MAIGMALFSRNSGTSISINLATFPGPDDWRIANSIHLLFKYSLVRCEYTGGKGRIIQVLDIWSIRRVEIILLRVANGNRFYRSAMLISPKNLKFPLSSICSISLTARVIYT